MRKGRVRSLLTGHCPLAGSITGRTGQPRKAWASEIPDLRRCCRTRIRSVTKKSITSFPVRTHEGCMSNANGRIAARQLPRWKIIPPPVTLFQTCRPSPVRFSSVSVVDPYVVRWETITDARARTVHGPASAIPLRWAVAPKYRIEWKRSGVTSSQHPRGCRDEAGKALRERPVLRGFRSSIGSECPGSAGLATRFAGPAGPGICFGPGVPPPRGVTR